MNFSLSLQEPVTPGTEAVTAYAATVCVTFFSIMERMFCEAGNTLFTFWNLEM